VRTSVTEDEARRESEKERLAEIARLKARREAAAGPIPRTHSRAAAGERHRTGAATDTRAGGAHFPSSAESADSGLRAVGQREPASSRPRQGIPRQATPRSGVAPNGASGRRKQPTTPTIVGQTWNDRPDGAGGKRRSGFQHAPPRRAAQLAALPLCGVAHGRACRHHVAADLGAQNPLAAARSATAKRSHASTAGRRHNVISSSVIYFTSAMAGASHLQTAAGIAAGRGYKPVRSTHNDSPFSSS